MQIFVRRADFTSAADEVVYILASYDDSVTVDPSWHGDPTAVTIMTVTPDAISSPGGLPYLFPNWRNNFQTPILTGEANRRILTAFPDYSQRNANSEINGYITTYGADTTLWPAYQQSRNAEITRCWNYVNDVRAKANAMGGTTLPNDPTDDANWPTVISPYVPS